MTRSVRRTPITGVTTAVSDRPGKALAHRRTRVAARCALAQGDEPPDRRLTEDPWDYPKDGKLWHGRCRPGLLRK